MDILNIANMAAIFTDKDNTYFDMCPHAFLPMHSIGSVPQPSPFTKADAYVAANKRVTHVSLTHHIIS